MKKNVLILSLVSAFSVANAQYVIEQKDFPEVGDSVIYAYDSAFSDITGQLDISGDEMEWDFSFLSAIREDTFRFEEPSSAPSGDIFGSATVVHQQDAAYYFNRITAKLVRTMGMSTSITNFIDTSMLDSSITMPDDAVFRYIDGGLFYIDLPAEYGDYEVATDIGYFSGYIGDSIDVPSLGSIYVDSFRLKETVNFDSEIDGYGTIILPVGDYFVARQKIKYDRLYSVEVCAGFPGFCFWVAVPGFEFTVKELTYRFFGENQIFPLLEISMETESNSFSRSRFQLEPPGSQVGLVSDLVNKIYLRKDGKMLYINSSDIINSVEITNMLGQNIAKVSANSRSVEIPFNGNGIYILRATTSEGKVISKKIGLH